jgi:hypothetical protein
MSDFYLTIVDTKKEKTYLVPVDTCFQMTQTIRGFEEKFAQVDKEVKEKLSYFEAKTRLQSELGTIKAQRKLIAMMNNRVEDDV